MPESEKDDRIEKLKEKYMAGEATDDEIRELLRALGSPEDEIELIIAVERNTEDSGVVY